MNIAKNNFKNKLKNIKILRYMYHLPKDIFIHFTDCIKILNYKRENINASKQIRELKNIHKDERCFILGNGPSLTVRDLENIKNEITFASNRIYGIYPQTTWRPTYYCSADPDFAKAVKRNIVDIVKDSKMSFLNLRCVKDYDKEITNLDNVYFYYIPRAWAHQHIKRETKKVLPKFSEDFSKIAYSSATITYEIIQLAVYMGFKEIYLLGVDHEYKLYSENGIVKENPNVKSSYFKGIAEINDGEYKMSATNSVFNPKTTYGYESANNYAKKNGIIIKNATRGGKLEVFERINLDDLI